MSDRQKIEPPISAGVFLKGARMEKNLSVADVAARLYLNVRVIEAIEQDDYENLPLPIYVYGYLQNYARLLGVPADEALAMYKKNLAEPQEREPVPEPEAPAPAEPQIKQPGTWPRLVLYLVLFLLVLASFTLWRSRYALEPAEPAKPTGRIDYPITIVEHPDDPFFRAPNTERTESRQADAVPETPQARVAQEPADALQTAPERAPEIQTGIADRAPEDSVLTFEEKTLGVGPDTVRLVLSHACWIEIFDTNNEKTFYDLARAGQTLNLNGTAPFSVLIGNADAVSVEFNGALFDITPHVTGIGIARFTLGENQ